MRILMVDDEKDICDDLTKFLRGLDHQVDQAFDGNEALGLIKQNRYDLIISDVTLPLLSGIDLVRKAKEGGNNANFLLISGMDDIIQTINAIDLGILDFLTKPVSVEKLAEIIGLVKQKVDQENRTSLKKQGKTIPDGKTVRIDDYSCPQNYSFYHVHMGEIGIYSEKSASIFNKLKKLQEFPDIPVLIEGETGTGKEIIAKYIHYDNPLNEGQFIGVNCSAFPRELFEAELFGYEKGSFTGADSKGRDGKIKLAEKGTLFLDEITEIPMDLQAKLLRVLQEREFFKVGGNQKHMVNTRICCATNKNIHMLIEKGLFREDLYYRLNVCQVIIPPLRERKEEIIPLTISFIKEFKKLMKKHVESVESDALKLLYDYDWPGNIRELKNTISKVVLFSEGKHLQKKDFLPYINRSSGKTKGIKLNLNDLELPDSPFNLKELEDAIVKKTLDKFNGNKTKTAEFLGLTRIQLYRRFK